MKKIDDLISVMARLRDPEDGCPWDVEQHFESIAPYTIEEAYEVADAITRNDFEGLKDELGDLLFQIVFHTQMAQEAGYFNFDDVVSCICEKMIRRHPHVFGDATIKDSQEQSEAWEEHKARERSGQADQSALAGVAAGIPEWQRAVKLQKKAARVGFDWPEVGPVADKVAEELAEVTQAQGHDEIEDELGDLLFACVNLARHHAVDPGVALRRANAKFENRFRSMEQLADGDFERLNLDAMEALWERAKAQP